ncbi:aminoacyl-tRNA deacylase [Melioribacteraceae bacterium 4301-Me]|uniref:aminoacyl-tRNA deacylase n=1 Tax=Pyranulibacter aquaticus TaxID=3163344 RepID=UPI003595697A
MPSQKVKEFLDQHKIKYVTIKHSLAFTAQEIAASAHIKGKELAKTVLVKVDGKMIMTVLPASYKIDFDLLKKYLGCNNCRLANETEFKDKFPDCEVGAMPPFGNLFNMEVVVADSIAKNEFIAFNACSHTELIQMEYKDFEKLVKPRVLSFSYQSKL